MQADEIARQLLDARVEMTGYFRSVIIDRHLAEDVFPRRLRPRDQG